MEFHPKRRNFELVRAILKILIACSVSRVELSHKYQFVGVSNRGKRINFKMKVDIFYVLSFADFTRIVELLTGPVRKYSHTESFVPNHVSADLFPTHTTNLLPWI